MAPNCWSRTLHSRRGQQIRLYERVPGGPLQLATWVPGKGANRVSLRHRDKETALRTASRVLAELDRQDGAAAPDTAASLTLGEVFRRFVAEARHLPDGSLKTEGYLRHCEATARHLAIHFSHEFPVSEFSSDTVGGYVVRRREGGITGKMVGTSTIQRELAMLKAALNWACGKIESGRPLLRQNPLEKYRAPRERNPKRPLISEETIDKLHDVAARVHPHLQLLIVLARTTGRRLSSILGLRWDDLDFENELILWRGELDKKRKTWNIPMPRNAKEALLAHRARFPAIGNTLVFPHPARRDHAVTRHLAAYWLKQAYARAGLQKPDGGLWHVFRRVWATERKHLPPVDVAAAGGWSDVGTLVQVYQQPDQQTLREVINLARTKKPEIRFPMDRTIQPVPLSRAQHTH